MSTKRKISCTLTELGKPSTVREVDLKAIKNMYWNVAAADKVEVEFLLVKIISWHWINGMLWNEKHIDDMEEDNESIGGTINA